MPLVKLCQHVWSLSTPDEEGCLDGGQMRALMVMSSLDNATLGTIWTMVDSEQRGKVRMGARQCRLDKPDESCHHLNLDSPPSNRRLITVSSVLSLASWAKHRLGRSLTPARLARRRSRPSWRVSSPWSRTNFSSPKGKLLPRPFFPLLSSDLRWVRCTLSGIVSVSFVCPSSSLAFF
jgi:hypothetical protein